MTAPPAHVSIVVPTFGEAGTVHALLTRIAAAVPDGVRAAVGFADDSADHTCGPAPIGPGPVEPIPDPLS
ncbi:hypothetical protein C3492_30465 [Streptomyces sp. Ru62]|uniref:hypothetical protein n=1 Tax=Streptomyces sp. Ru62 TaxID=2080745 RepID=UPI000CDDDADF|nr:hypothetical protein [Streptomyces sp. Ru62]POX59867.1 hypothetical protein C3492_30465 [Streptomyces sp. Ru62]